MCRFPASSSSLEKNILQSQVQGEEGGLPDLLNCYSGQKEWIDPPLNEYTERHNSYLEKCKELTWTFCFLLYIFLITFVFLCGWVLRVCADGWCCYKRFEIKLYFFPKSIKRLRYVSMYMQYAIMNLQVFMWFSEKLSNTVSVKANIHDERSLIVKALCYKNHHQIVSNLIVENLKKS